MASFGLGVSKKFFNEKRDVNIIDIPQATLSVLCSICVQLCMCAFVDIIDILEALNHQKQKTRKMLD